VIAAGLLWALAAVADAAPPARPPQVWLAPVVCANLSDVDVRGPLRVELRGRLVEDVAVRPQDFVLVSLSCDGAEVEVLAIRHDHGDPVRRLVPLADVAPAARGRDVAVAIGELLRVEAARENPPPPPAVVYLSPPAPVPRRATLAVTAVPLSLFGDYISFKHADALSLSNGAAIRWAVELGDEEPPSPSWKGALAYGLGFVETSATSNITNALMFLLQRRGLGWMPGVGVGARFGWFSEHLNGGPYQFSGGPTGLLAFDFVYLRRYAIGFDFEGGYDLRGAGAWIAPSFAWTWRFY
jgi:hypothetical protein